MSNSENGGPAFPKAGLDPWMRAIDVSPGMSLRDWFAGQAMQVIGGNINAPRGVGLDAVLDELARASYALADAMLKAREA